jgi:hypothetical protein
MAHFIWLFRNSVLRRRSVLTAKCYLDTLCWKWGNSEQCAHISNMSHPKAGCHIGEGKFTTCLFLQGVVMKEEISWSLSSPTGCLLIWLWIQGDFCDVSPASLPDCTAQHPTAAVRTRNLTESLEFFSPCLWYVHVYVHPCNKFQAVGRITWILIERHATGSRL